MELQQLKYTGHRAKSKTVPQSSTCPVDLVCPRAMLSRLSCCLKYGLPLRAIYQSHITCNWCGTYSGKILESNGSWQVSIMTAFSRCLRSTLYDNLQWEETRFPYIKLKRENRGGSESTEKDLCHVAKKTTAIAALFRRKKIGCLDYNQWLYISNASKCAVWLIA